MSFYYYYCKDRSRSRLIANLIILIYYTISN
jgi:hypothetical protein